MKYIIMCGGRYRDFAETPKQMLKVNGEEIVARTIRLLKENGIEDISISTNDDRFEKFGLPILRHENNYYMRMYNDYDGYWCNGFYPTDEPTCYIFGDVFFSPDGISKIVETETDDIAFFASAPPFAPEYPKPYIEPFAFKATNTDHLHQAIEDCKRRDAEGVFNRKPIAWELWGCINNPDNPGGIYYDSYVHINDYTCDIDNAGEIALLERFSHVEGN